MRYEMNRFRTELVLDKGSERIRGEISILAPVESKRLNIPSATQLDHGPSVSPLVDIGRNDLESGDLRTPAIWSELQF